MSEILNFVKRDLKFHVDAVKENYRLSKDPLLLSPQVYKLLRGTGLWKTITLIYLTVVNAHNVSLLSSMRASARGHIGGHRAQRG